MIKTISGYISRKCKQKQQRIKRKWLMHRLVMSVKVNPIALSPLGESIVESVRETLEKNSYKPVYMWRNK